MAGVALTIGTRRCPIILPPTPTPWLRVPVDTGESMFVEFDNFYNIVDKRLVKLDRMNAYSIDCNILCVGSSRGSLAFVCQSGRVYFGYPLAGGGMKGEIYGDQEFDDNQYWIDKSNHGLHSLTRFYTKIGDLETVLCYPRYHPQNPTPENYHDFYVQWSCSYPGKWTRYPNLFHKDDPPIVYCEKTKTVYKLSCNCNGPWVVELWDMSDERINVTSRINVAFDSSYEIETRERELRARCHQDRYLVLTGEYGGGRGDSVLYLVVRHHNRELGVSQTRAMDVFRFDLVRGKMSYTTELDDHAFFIGQGSDSFAVPVEKCGPGGLKPNSVYIADDLRVFGLKNRSITPILDTGDMSMTRFQSLWIPPPTPKQIEESKKWIKHMEGGDEESPI
ncbi:uncharacterized protein LOC141638484 [Silene latifolia]|uniref:uncharacterized protein LOC141638484 n=1 Tax=Silene latifolia TaxID=37657 RepID=UPI003D770001